MHPKPTGFKSVNQVSVILFPNPTNSSVQVNLSRENWLVAYKVFNLKGNAVQKGVLSTSSPSVDIHNLSKDIYIIRLKSDH